MLVVAHKVVSKAEGRVRSLAGVEPGAEARRIAEAQGKDPRLLQVVLDESVRVVRESPRVLICETPHGFVCANAGVDRSNAGGPRRGGAAARGSRRLGARAARGAPGAGPPW